MDDLNANNLRIDTKAPYIYKLLENMKDDSEHKINFKLNYKTEPWDVITMSRYIELLLMLIPTGNFYFYYTDYSNWIIVDGYKRLLTLKKFVIDKSFSLQKLQYLKHYENLNWDNLGRPGNRRIEIYSIPSYFIAPGSKLNESIDIMNKINDRGFLL